MTPTGELIADPGRGLVFGNRGCLHDDERRIVRGYAGKRWISCRLEFNGRRRTLMRPRHYTELFFLDEATAFAAGHRPCFECRREDYRRFAGIWRQVFGVDEVSAADIDARLHSERVDEKGRKRLHELTAPDQLPDGVFVLHDGAPHLVLGDRLLEWSMPAYGSSRPRLLSSKVSLITPPSVVEVLRRGWDSALPLVHPSATQRTSAARR